MQLQSAPCLHEKEKLSTIPTAGNPAASTRRTALFNSFHLALFESAKKKIAKLRFKKTSFGIHDGSGGHLVVSTCSYNGCRQRRLKNYKVLWTAALALQSGAD
ncbi:uncharacterized protein PHALS_13529 [Plasmopara halstedii]|uniref:Uncharacterized protein n=1 Tax=Plasmopara halstedii TaxID=4781 RepID=A0A0P1APD5_PLAHL|nr:uncharacterized protein PHALS_13529 [Plasmopara halstedii]CEG43326.1 hypothetical protein PHALS_13529 [Plasmopara halstedii]|eukprot:XP_024579695.1 hypothetical protein PHALS_13529 [Plasmopara halstedii]